MRDKAGMTMRKRLDPPHGDRGPRLQHSFYPVLFGNGPQNAAGISCGDDSGGYIARDDASGPDHRSVADRDTLRDGDIAADPDIVPDPHGQRAHDTLVALVGQQGVVDGVDADVGADVDMVADCYGRFVEDREVEIAVEVVADGDLRTEVAIEGTVDAVGSTQTAQQFAQNGVALALGRGRQRVEPERHLFGPPQGGADLRRHGVEPCARGHFFKVVHRSECG